MWDLNDDLREMIDAGETSSSATAHCYIDARTGAILQFGTIAKIDPAIKADPNNVDVSFKVIGVDFSLFTWTRPI